MRRTLLSVLFFGPFAMHAQVAPAADPGMQAAMDAVLRSHFPSDEPGAAALVSVNGQVLWSGASGLADVRSGAPLGTEGVFRIGSITKQFTATAILQLVEAGSVRLDADIRTYIDFPEKSSVITVEHLLTHTSGIPNYTDLPSFEPQTFAKGVSLSEVIGTFKDEPLQFTPGSQWAYSNSGYVLLGQIIETVTGMPYHHYVQDRFVRPLGLQHLTASPDNAPVTNEVLGHQLSGQGFAEALPLDLSWPHAAGVIRSSVGDLHTWNTAVMNGKACSPELMERAFREHPLTDGTTVPYGYGWGVKKLLGRSTLEHNGGINGFVSSGIYIPRDGIYVIVLSNREDLSAEVPAVELAAIALGAPYPTTALPLAPAALAEFTGVYESDKGVVRTITVENGKLFSQREGSSKLELVCVAADRFRFAGDIVLVDFKRENGKVVGATMSTRQGDEQMIRTDRPLPEPPVVVVVDAATLKQYAGTYELMPDFMITVRAEGTRLFAQATGQEEFEVYPSGRTTFFYKVVDARLEFLPDAKGKVKRMKLYQGGAELEGKRIK